MEAASAVPIVMNAYDVTTIIHNINTLYSNVIDQFIGITLGMLALIGVVLPLVFAYFQRRKINADHQELSKKIEAETLSAKTILIEELRRELKEERNIILSDMAEIKKNIHLEIDKIRAGADAKAYHLQANASIKDELYIQAFLDCAIAIRNYIDAKDEANLIRVLDAVLLHSVFPNLKKADFDGEEILLESFNGIYKAIEALNDRGRFSDNLISLKRAYKAAFAR